MSIKVSYGAGNSVERPVSGRTTVYDVITDPRVSVGLGLPDDPSHVETRRNGCLLEQNDTVSDGDTLRVSKKSNTKG